MNISSKFVLLIYNIFHFWIGVYSFPQIFNEAVCHYDFVAVDKKLSFIDKLWTINTPNFTLYFSLCKNRQNKCRNQTSSCLIQKNSEKIWDLGSKFQTIDSDEFILESVDGVKCPNAANKNYKIIIELAKCTNIIKQKPRLIHLSECEFRVSIMNPECQPKCTHLINGAYFLDMRSFPKNIQVQSDNRIFSITPCGDNTKCGLYVGACEILKNNITVPIANMNSQSIYYNMNKNELTARGKFKTGKRAREFEMLIKCNWRYDLYNAMYKKPSTQGKKYHFEIESSYGCVKLPQNCNINSISNLQYNLSFLNKPITGWLVSNVPKGKILLNICGDLKYQSNNICSKQYSQVCHQETNDTFINRGSILTSFQVIDDITLKAIFSSGSQCGNTLYSTEIEFQCSKKESGPIFKEFKNCVMVVMWKTPHACPVDYYKGKNCRVSDRINNWNLQGLFSESDKIHQLSQNVQLVYNLCGFLHTPCNNFNNTSFCLKNQQGKEMIMGWYNDEVISENATLQMEFHGDLCFNNRHRGKVVVIFICSYESPPPVTKIDIIEDDCQFKMTIFTALACVSKASFVNCIYETKNNSCFDLTSLSNKNKNHIIQVDENVEIIFNLCGPIISDSYALCRQDTMFCMMNNSEVNINKRFTSLGGISSPIFKNNSLIIESKMGGLCENFDYYTSILHLECSQKQMRPQFLSKNECTYNFIWKTPEACLQNNMCLVGNKKNEQFLDLTFLQQKILKINNANNSCTYEVHLCLNNYKKICTNESQLFPLKRELYLEKNTNILTLNMEQKCINNQNISKIIFEFQCSEKEIFEKKQFLNCILTIIIKTPILCITKKDNNISNPDIEKTTMNVQKLLISDHSHLAENCTIINKYNSQQLKLIDINSTKILFEDDVYYLNFGGQFKGCNAFLCKNNRKILPSITVCPNIFFNNSRKTVKIQYFSQDHCTQNAFYEADVWLKCAESPSQKIIKRGECKFTVEYNLPIACSLFEVAKKSALTQMMIILSGIASIIIFLAISIFIWKKKCFRFDYLNLSSYKKDAIPIYSRDLRQ